MTRRIAVVDCGMGNIHSLLACLRKLVPADEVVFTDSANDIAGADCVFLPGDGAFSACMAQIDERGLRATLQEAARNKPFFGICVGMQALFASSEEGPGEGLGVLRGRVLRFPVAAGAKVPLMGWLEVDKTMAGRENPLLGKLPEQEYFYFLHSFFVPVISGEGPEQDQVVLQGTHTAPFAAAVASGKLFATQFHPEKSSEAGLGLLAEFLSGV